MTDEQINLQKRWIKLLKNMWNMRVNEKDYEFLEKLFD